MSKEIKTIISSKDKISSDAEGFYNNYWSDSSSIKNLTHEKNKQILKKFFPESINNKKVLEIGVGGEGGMIYSLKENNQIFGVDISDSAIKNASKFGLTVDKKNADKDKLSYDGSYFDVVFAFEVFEHFSNPQFAIEEIFRVLKAGGKLLISVPNELTYHWPRVFYPELYHKKNFSEFLMINGFDVKVFNDELFQNSYKVSNLSKDYTSWSWYFLAEKLGENNSDKYFQNALYFWNLKNEVGIQTRPIEALDLFEKSYLLDKDNHKKKLYYLNALLYRAINDDQERFLKLLSENIGYRKFNNEEDLAFHLYMVIKTVLTVNLFEPSIIEDNLIVQLINELSELESSKKYLQEISDIIKTFEELLNN